jgi:hypothetical protein
LGHVDVTYASNRRGLFEQSQLQLVDRTFLRGDYVRKPSDSKRATGIILDVETQVKVMDAFNQTPLDTWISTDKLVNYVRISRGDHVVYGEWIGVVEEVLEEAMVQFVDGTVERVADLGSGLLQPGDTGQVNTGTELFSLLQRADTVQTLNVPLPPYPIHLHPAFKSPENVSRVLSSKQVTVAVNW